MQQIERLEEQRSHLYGQLAQSGDFQRGTVGATYRRCGKPNCVCADPQHPGHGPRQRLTRSVKGRTESVELRTDGEVEKARREVANYQRFEEVSRQIIDVNEQICEQRPPGRIPAAAPASAVGRKKGGSPGTSTRSSRRR